MTRLASGPTTAWPAPAHAATHGLKPPSCCLQLRIRDFRGICSLTTSPSRCKSSMLKYMPCLGILGNGGERRFPPPRVGSMKNARWWSVVYLCFMYNIYISVCVHYFAHFQKVSKIMHKRNHLLRWGFTTKDEGETIHLHMRPKKWHPISSQLQGCHRSAAGPKLTTLLRTSAMGLKEYFQIISNPNTWFGTTKKRGPNSPAVGCWFSICFFLGVGGVAH